jgi:hypothetical protein
MINPKKSDGAAEVPEKYRKSTGEVPAGGKRNGKNARASHNGSRMMQVIDGMLYFELCLYGN